MSDDTSSSENPYQAPESTANFSVGDVRLTLPLELSGTLASQDQWAHADFICRRMIIWGFLFGLLAGIFSEVVLLVIMMGTAAWSYSLLLKYGVLFSGFPLIGCIGFVWKYFLHFYHGEQPDRQVRYRITKQGFERKEFAPETFTPWNQMRNRFETKEYYFLVCDQWISTIPKRFFKNEEESEQFWKFVQLKRKWLKEK